MRNDRAVPLPELFQVVQRGGALRQGQGQRKPAHATGQRTILNPDARPAMYSQFQHDTKVQCQMGQTLGADTYYS